MPNYDYRCEGCGHEFEEFQRMTEDPLVLCPSCNTPSLRRMIGSGAGMIFKGSGFYLTDYKKKNNGSPSSAASPATQKNTATTAAANAKSDSPAPSTSSSGGTSTSGSTQSNGSEGSSSS